MHSFIAAFFAMLFSFGHAQTARQSEVAAASENHSFIQAPMPTREELAHQQFETVTRYAVDSCVSCRQMNVESDAR